MIFLMILFYLIRVFNVCVPTEMVPWCAPISTIIYMNLFIKATMVICNAFDITGEYALIEIIGFFVLQSF